MDNSSNVSICFGCGCKIKSSEEFCSICKTKNPHFNPEAGAAENIFSDIKKSVENADEDPPIRLEEAPSVKPAEAPPPAEEDKKKEISENLIIQVKGLLAEGKENDAVMLLCDELNVKSGEAKEKVAQIKESLPKDEPEKKEDDSQLPKKEKSTEKPAEKPVEKPKSEKSDRKEDTSAKTEESQTTPAQAKKFNSGIKLFYGFVSLAAACFSLYFFSCYANISIIPAVMMAFFFGFITFVMKTKNLAGSIMGSLGVFIASMSFTFLVMRVLFKLEVLFYLL